MARRVAQAEWSGEISNGAGEVRIGGERLPLAYTPAWLQEGAGTNPEELLAAAHAASFATALQVAFSDAQHRVGLVRVRAELHLDRREGKWTITRSDLEGEVDLKEDPRAREISQSEFQRIAEDAAASCPVSRALAGVEITIDARPLGPVHSPDASRTERRATAPHRDGDGRRRRALEGQVVGRMRAQARQRHASGV
jgi:osmotically inducible protein OsmC